MNAKELKVGEVYWIKSSMGPFKAQLLEVKVIPPYPYSVASHKSKTITRWICLKLSTKRQIIIKSAGKFFKPAVVKDVVTTQDLSDSR